MENKNMQSMYAQYLEERENKFTYENKKGFITYCFSGEECFIETVYIVPAFRRSKAATNMANIVSESAKASGCKFLTCTVDPAANGSTESLKVILANEFLLLGINPDGAIVFKKMIQ